MAVGKWSLSDQIGSWDAMYRDSRERFVQRLLLNAWRSGVVTAIAASGELIEAEDDQFLTISGTLAQADGFHFDHRSADTGVGQGAGNSHLGDTLIPDKTDTNWELHVDDMTAGTLRKYVAQYLSYPLLVRAARGKEVIINHQLTTLRPSGPFSCLNLRQTAKANLRNNARHGQKPAKIGRFTREDLRFNAYEEIRRPQSQAVLIVLSDRTATTRVSDLVWGRATATWLIEALRCNYQEVAYQFVVHGEEPTSVDKATFFTTRDQRQGPICKGYDCLISEVLPCYPEPWDRYVLHLSDGWGQAGDCSTAYRLMDEKITRLCVAFGYGQLPTRKGESGNRSLHTILNENRTKPNATIAKLGNEDDIGLFFRSFFLNARSD